MEMINVALFTSHVIKTMLYTSVNNKPDQRLYPMNIIRRMYFDRLMQSKGVFYNLLPQAQLALMNNLRAVFAMVWLILFI